MSVEEYVLDDKGNIDMDKMEVISFDSSSSSYRLLGQKVGNSFKDGAKLK